MKQIHNKPGEEVLENRPEDLVWHSDGDYSSKHGLLINATVVVSFSPCERITFVIGKFVRQRS